MEDKFSKYLQLSFNLIFTFLGFVLLLLLVMLGLKFTFRLLDYIPWFVYIYILFIILVPTMLFTSIFVIYFRRSAIHPSLFVRVVSYCLFVLALVAWAATFVWDMWHFFKTGSREISSYFSYNIFLLVGSVAGIFLIGVMQALTTEKEQDWMEKRRMREE